MANDNTSGRCFIAINSFPPRVVASLDARRAARATRMRARTQCSTCVAHLVAIGGQRFSARGLAMRWQARLFQPWDRRAAEQVKGEADAVCLPACLLASHGRGTIRKADMDGVYNRPPPPPLPAPATTSHPYAPFPSPPLSSMLERMLASSPFNCCSSVVLLFEPALKGRGLSRLKIRTGGVLYCHILLAFFLTAFYMFGLILI